MLDKKLASVSLGALPVVRVLIVTFIGSMGCDGLRIDLFNLLTELEPHPIGSTVSRQTIEQNGFSFAPDCPLRIGETFLLRKSA